MKNLSFRAPGRGGPLADLVERAWPFATQEQLRRAFADGDVRVGREVVRDEQAPVPGGAAIQVNAREGRLPPPYAPVPILQRGEDFCVVHKPAGWPSHPATPGGADARLLVATTLDLPLDGIWPVHRLDAAVSGVWLIALSKEAAGRLSGAFASAEVEKEYRALVPSLPWPEGVFRAGVDEKDAETRFRRLDSRGGVDELALVPVTGRTHQLRAHLAGAGTPILGDPLYGGIMIRGGLRLYSRRIAIRAEGIEASVEEPAGFWPGEPVFFTPDQTPVVTVSTATIVALERGHPWILPDAETSDVGRFRPGTLARVQGVEGQDGGLCRIEGSGRIAARAWSRPGLPASVDERIQAALARRARLLRERQARRPTNVFRLLHGEADGFPGLLVDYLDGDLRVLTMGRACDPLLDEVVDRLLAALAESDEAPAARAPGVVLVRHLIERPRGEFHAVRVLRGQPRSGTFLVSERGLSFEVDHGLGEPLRSRPGFGLFPDQRANRQRLDRDIRARREHRGRGGRWLNLFCHTGAFSVTALAAGADEVVSVDLSRPYLDTLQRNLAHNGLDPSRHQGVKLDAERYLERLPDRERFDGIVLDPPTAAASGRRFWSARKGQGRLLERCVMHLKSGGLLLACRNDHGARHGLAQVLTEAAQRQGIRMQNVKEAPPGPDFPRLPGFPEGDAFEGVQAVRG